MKIRSNIVLLCIFCIIPLCIFAQITIDADSAMAAIEARIEQPVIPNYKLNIQKFGAIGNGFKDCKPAFDKALKAIEKRKGGILNVPAGTYLINGPLHLPGNFNLHLEKGARLVFGTNPKDYLPMVLTSWEGTTLYNYSPMIYAYQKSNIAITGAGIIDGEGHDLWATWKPKENTDKLISREMNHNETTIEDRKFGSGHFLRPQLIQFVACSKILVADIRIEDSPFWCLHFIKSKSITISGISYDAQNKNNDGVDLEYTSDVLIENVQFNNADDNIAIKAGRDNDGRSNSSTPSENIVIRNNRFHGLHALVVGSEMSAGVQNVFLVDNVVSDYLTRGIYLKTNSDRGGFIKNIYVRNLELLDTQDCIFITSNYHGEGSGKFPSQISNISILNVTCEKASDTGIVMEGYASFKVKNVLLDQIHIKESKNGISLFNTENIIFNEVIVGEKAGVPSSAK